MVRSIEKEAVWHQGRILALFDCSRLSIVVATPLAEFLRRSFALKRSKSYDSVDEMVRANDVPQFTHCRKSADHQISAPGLYPIYAKSYTPSSN